MVLGEKHVVIHQHKEPNMELTREITKLILCLTISIVMYNQSSSIILSLLSGLLISGLTHILFNRSVKGA
jgi:hypothetical protein